MSSSVVPGAGEDTFCHDRPQLVRLNRKARATLLRHRDKRWSYALARMSGRSGWNWLHSPAESGYSTGASSGLNAADNAEPRLLKFN
jgi:hypothetical protein